MSRKANIKAALLTAQAALSSPPGDPDHIGDLVWCDPVSGFRVNAQKAQDAFTSAGLDPIVLLPATPDHAVAFSRAILTVRTMIQGRGYTLLAAGSGPNGESRYSVVKVDRGNAVHTSDEAIYSCPKDGTKPYVERQSHDPNVTNILEMLRISELSFFETYTSDDVRQAFVRQLDLYAGIPCRNSPPHVVYWVSPQASKAIQAVADVFTSLGWGSVAMFAGSRSQARSMAAVTHAVNSGLESQLSEFATEAKSYADNFNGMRPSTIERRIQEAKDLKAKAALYRAILGAAVESVDDQITAVETSLKSTLGLIEGEPATVLVTPATSTNPPSKRDGKTMTVDDCKKRAAWERDQATRAREASDNENATKHDKAAIAYDLLAESLAA